MQSPIRHNLHLSVSREESSTNKLNDLVGASCRCVEVDSQLQVSLIKSPVCCRMRSIIVYVAFKWQATEVTTYLLSAAL